MKKLKLRKLKDIKDYIISKKDYIFSNNIRSKVISIVGVCAMAVLGVMAFSSINFNEDKLTPLAFSYEAPKNINSKNGTNNNPFIFVEIVPDKKMSKMRYLFDTKDIKSDNKLEEEILEPNIDTTGKSEEEIKKEKTKKIIEKLKELEDKKIISKGDNTPLKYVDNNKYEKENGYFMHVEENKGDYDIEVKGETDYSFKYIGKDMGEYKWTKDDNKPINYAVPRYSIFKDDTTSSSLKIWVDEQDVCVEEKEEDRFTIKSNNYFKKYVLGLDTAKKQKEYRIDFYTVTPEEINGNVEEYENDENKKGKSIADTADFIYSTDYAFDASDYNGNGFQYDKAWTYNMTNSEKNLSGTAAIKLMKRVATENKVPLVLDYTKNGFNQASKRYNKTIGRDGTATEMYKLVVYSAMYGPARFYNYFMNDFNGTYQTAVCDEGGHSVYIQHSGSDTGNHNPMITDEHVLFPGILGKSGIDVRNTLGVVNGDLYVGNISNHFDYTKSVIENVYFNIQDNATKNFSNTNFNKDCYTSYTDKEKAFKGLDTSNLSCANIFKYLVNYADNNQSIEKDEYNILDVEPCKDFKNVNFTLKNNNYTKEFEEMNNNNTWCGVSYPKDKNAKNSFANRYSELVYRNLVPNYYGKINIVKKTSSELAGDMCDYITNYDAMYFGDNTGMFNVVNGKTEYNDPGLDGRIYTHIGDRMIGGMRMSGLLTKNQRRLGGSGIVDDVYQPKRVENGDNSNFLARSYVPLWGHEGWKDTSNVYRHRTKGSNVTPSFYNTFVDNSSRILTAESYRLSGNDITQKVCDKLKEYVDGGFPVIAANKLKSCDTEMLDKTSAMYKFFNYAKEKDNVVSTSNISDGTKENVIKNAFKRSRVNIVLYSHPTDYKRTDSGTITYNKDDNVLKFKFKITDNNASSNARYTAYLIVDSNVDGHYEKSETIKRIKNLKKNVVYNLDKAIIADDETKKDSDLVGGVSWQLLVEKDADTINRAEKKGVTCIKRKTTDKKTIKILQIMPDTSSENTKYGKFSEFHIEPNASEARFNMEKDNDKFKELINNLDDFDFQIKSTTVSSYVEYFISHTNSTKSLYQPASSEVPLSNNDSNKFKPDAYDIVVLGLGDRYTDFYTAYNSRFGTDANKINEAKKLAVANLVNYIDSKRVLVYTHDIMSFINQDFTNYSQTGKINSQEYWPLEQKGQYGGTYGGEANWGYSINTYLRDRLGVDRFGITKNKQLDDTNSASIDHDDALLTKYYSDRSRINSEINSDYPYVYRYIERQGFSNGIFSYNLHDRKVSDKFKTWFHEFDINSKEMGVKDGVLYYGELLKRNDPPAFHFFDAAADTSVANIAKNDVTVSGNDSDGLAFVEKLNKYSIDNTNDKFYSSDVTYTNKMKMVNDGQMAHYPYELNNGVDEDKQPVVVMNTVTHCPYYQLNLDNSNAMVWYCLTNTDFDRYAKESKLYSNSPNDVRNYYGIYSVDNIYFCNIGQCNGSNIGVQAQEMKMFINVLVAAGKNKKGGEGIDIENSDGQTEDRELGTVDVVYAYSDRHNASHDFIGDAKDKVNIDFSVYDTAKTNDDMYITIYKRNASNKWVRDTQAKIDGKSTNDNATYKINTDTTYHLKVNAKDHMGNNNYCYYRLVAKADRGESASRGYENVIKVVRRNLIDMNKDD